MAKTKKLNLEVVLKANRVKLIYLPDFAQATVATHDGIGLRMTIYGYNSKNEPVQLEAPFSFSDRQARDSAFADEQKLEDFAKAVFATQMANIDPDLDTTNFKNSKTK